MASKTLQEVELSSKEIARAAQSVRAPLGLPSKELALSIAESVSEIGRRVGDVIRAAGKVQLEVSGCCD